MGANCVVAIEGRRRELGREAVQTTRPLRALRPRERQMDRMQPLRRDRKRGAHDGPIEEDNPPSRAPQSPAIVRLSRLKKEERARDHVMRTLVDLVDPMPLVKEQHLEKIVTVRGHAVQDVTVIEPLHFGARDNLGGEGVARNGRRGRAASHRLVSVTRSEEGPRVSFRLRQGFSRRAATRRPERRSRRAPA